MARDNYVQIGVHLELLLVLLVTQTLNKSRPSKVLVEFGLGEYECNDPSWHDILARDRIYNFKVFKSMSLIVREPDIAAPHSANLMFICQYRNQNNEDCHLTMKWYEMYSLDRLQFNL